MITLIKAVRAARKESMKYIAMDANTNLWMYKTRPVKNMADRYWYNQNGLKSSPRKLGAFKFNTANWKTSIINVDQIKCL